MAMVFQLHPVNVPPLHLSYISFAIICHIVLPTPPNKSEYDNRKCYDIGAAINNYMDSPELEATLVFNIDDTNITKPIRTQIDELGVSNPVSSQQKKAHQR